MAVHPAGKQNADYFSAFDPNRAIGDYEFVVFDTELTGLSPRRDEIVSIGAVRIKELQIIVDDYFYSHSQTIKTTYTAGTFIHRTGPGSDKAKRPRVERRGRGQRPAKRRRAQSRASARL